MADGVSSRTMPWEIMSTRYVNGSYPGYTNDLIPETPGIITESFKPSFSFDNILTAHDGDSMMAHSVTPYPVWGNDGLNFVVATSGNKYILPGKEVRDYSLTLTPNDDDMGGWKRATEKSHEFESVKLHDKSNGLVKLESYIPNYSQFGDTQFSNKFISKHEDFGKRNNINDTGRLISQTYNQETRYRDAIFINNIKDRPWYNPVSNEYSHLNENAFDFFKERFEEGKCGGRVKGIGYGDLSGRKALAATINRNTIIVSDNLYSHAWELAEKNNLRGGEAQEFVDRYIESVMLYHEGSHVIDRDWSKSYDETERDIGSNIGKFFRSKAANSKENSLERRVSELVSKWHEGYSEKYAAKIGRLAGKYKEEAKEMGMDEAEIAEYVESRLEGAIDEDVKESDLEETIESRENYNDKGEYLEDNAGDGMEADAAEGE